MSEGRTRFVAVLDIGKTNIKVVVHDLDEGRDIADRRAPNEVRTDGPYPHFDIERNWAFVLDSLAALARRIPIDAISVTAHGASAALIGEEALALPVLDYEFDGPDSLKEAYDAERPPFAETFSPRLPCGLNVGAQIFWQAASFPALFAGVRHVVTYPQYWAWRLTGVAATEVTSLGSHTDLWNPLKSRFSSLVLRRGWAPLFAPTRSAFEVLGVLPEALARRTGLPPGTPVHCGLHDSNASLLPHLMTHEAPFSVVSTGTWVICFAVGGSLEGLDPDRDTLANVDAFGRPVPSARFMGGREFEILTGGGTADPDQAAIDEVLTREIMALPTFVRGNGPYPRAQGRWTVDPDTLRPGVRTAAASLYAALMTATSLGLIGAAGPTIVEGPFTGNRLLLEALAALTGRPVLASPDATGTSAGAALLARGKAARPAGTATEAVDAGTLSGPAFRRYAERWRALAG